MAEKLTISCGEGGLVCGATVEGRTEEEVVEQAIEHARRDHGVDLSRSKTLTRYLRTLVREA